MKEGQTGFAHVLLNVWMDESLELGWSVVLLCHVLPSPLSLLSMVSQWQLATLKLSATLPWAVGALPRSLWFLLLLTTLKSLLLPCLVSLTQTSHLAKVKESLSLTTSCVAVCYYFLFSWDSYMNPGRWGQLSSTHLRHTSNTPSLLTEAHYISAHSSI